MASQGTLAGALENDDYQSITKENNVIQGQVPNTSGTIPMPEDGAMAENQFSTVPKTAQGLRETSE